jgi:hypothetical protein
MHLLISFFLEGPDVGEQALILSGQIFNREMQPIHQCQACEEYFKHPDKWIILIKNNVPIHLKNGEFSFQMKLMCCSAHHQTPFYFYFTLCDVMTKKIVLGCLFSVEVKQWKSVSSIKYSKRRKT